MNKDDNLNKQRKSLSEFDKNMVDILEICLALEDYEDDTGEIVSERRIKIYQDLGLLRKQKNELDEEERVNRSKNILSRLNKELDDIGRDKFIFYESGSINYTWTHLNEKKGEK